MLDPEQLKAGGDVVSISSLVGVFIDALPHVAALFTAIWAILRVYETKTVQGWLKRLSKK